MKAVLLLSGGLDSTVLLYYLLEHGHSVLPLSFHYGQRHSKELASANRICKHLGLVQRIIELPNLFSGSALTGEAIIPHGHYEDESMKATVVPNRNMVFLALATTVAIQEKAHAVAYAAHAGDHAIYPDCRPEFTSAIASAMHLCDWQPIRLETPFLHLAKKEIAAIGRKLNVPMDWTWTCYEGGETPCGKCGACVERNEALNF